MTNHYRSIAESFLEEPRAHIAAMKNPKMRGGPFVGASLDHYDTVRRWHEGMVDTYDRLEKLAEALRHLEVNLLPQYSGESLEGLYADLPAELSGRIELFYDRDNRTPDYRVIEPLMYSSEFYDESLHQVRFSRIEQDSREFALTTPMLEYEPDQLLVDVPLGSKLLDEIFAGGLSADDLGRIADQLKLSGERLKLFDEYFEQRDDSGPEPADDNDVIEYIGHACVLVRHAGTTFLVDPVLSYSDYPDGDDDRFTFANLPPVIDYVMITHNHQDHMLFETLLKIRHRVSTIIVPRSTNASIVDPSMGSILRRLGFSQVVEMDDMEEMRAGQSSTITALPFLGEHGDLRIRTKSGWLLRLGEQSLLFAADSTNIAPGMYEQVHDLIGPVDTVFLGMESVGAPVSWVYGPLFTEPLPRALDQGRRLNGSNFDQARQIVDALRPQAVYVYAMGQEPWLGAIMSIEYTDDDPATIDSAALVDSVRAEGNRSKRLYIRETLTLDGTPLSDRTSATR